MDRPIRYSSEEMLGITEINARNSVHTQYACQVVRVSEDGRFVDVVHNALEWAACPDGDVVLLNSYGQQVVCSPTKPWTLCDIPVEQAYVRGQWSIRTRPRVGDKGILSVFYHDIRSIKEKGGFQAPSTLRVMAIDSASWRPGLPNHADVNSESGTYPSDDEWEIQGNDVSLKFTAPNDADSTANRQLDVKVGGVTLSIVVPQSGNPTVTFNAPNAAVNVTADTANINLSGSATVTAPTTTLNSNVTIGGSLTVTQATTLQSTLDVTGNATVGGTLGVTGAVSAPGFVVGLVDLAKHIHSGGTITPGNVTGAPQAPPSAAK